MLSVLNIHWRIYQHHQDTVISSHLWIKLKVSSEGLDQKLASAVHENVTCVLLKKYQ